MLDDGSYFLSFFCTCPYFLCLCFLLVLLSLLTFPFLSFGTILYIHFIYIFFIIIFSIEMFLLFSLFLFYRQFDLVPQKNILHIFPYFLISFHYLLCSVFLCCDYFFINKVSVFSAGHLWYSGFMGFYGGCDEISSCYYFPNVPSHAAL